MRIITEAEDLATFAAWRADPVFAAGEAHPRYGAFGRTYYPKIYGEGRRSASFAVVDDSQPLLLVACTTGAGKLDWFGMPLCLFARADIAPKAGRAAIKAAFGHLDSILAEQNLTDISVLDDQSAGTLSFV